MGGVPDEPILGTRGGPGMKYKYDASCCTLTPLLFLFTTAVLYILLSERDSEVSIYPGHFQHKPARLQIQSLQWQFFVLPALPVWPFFLHKVVVFLERSLLLRRILYSLPLMPRQILLHCLVQTALTSLVSVHLGVPWQNPNHIQAQTSMTSVMRSLRVVR